jgi:HEAT repeat protein
METTVHLEENEFKKLTKYFAYRYIINFEKVSICEYEVTLTVEPFMEFVEHRSKTIRVVAIRVLGEAKYKEAADLLIKALNDRSGLVRSTAAWYLGKIQDRKAVGPLLLAMNDHKCDYQSMMALRNILGSNLESEMVKGLGNSDSRICIGAAVVLLNFRKTLDVTNSLEKVLCRKNWKLRSIAARALGDGDSISACRAIVESFGMPERNGAVIDAKYEALKRLHTNMQESIRVIEDFLPQNILVTVNRR